MSKKYVLFITIIVIAFVLPKGRSLAETTTVDQLEYSNTAAVNAIFVDNALTNDCVYGDYSIENRDCSGSDGDAYNTPQEAADASMSGDTIYFRQGAYYEKTSTRAAVPVLSILTSGTVEAPITYKNYNDEEVILQAWDPGLSVRKYNAIELGIQPSDRQDVSGQGVQNIIIDGLIVEGGSYRGLGIFGPANKFADAADPTENVIIRNVIARNNTAFGIQTLGTLIDVTIEYCEAYDNIITGIEFGSLTKIWDAANPDDRMSAARYSTIRNCLTYNNNNPLHPGNSDGITLNHAYKCVLEDNISFNNSDDGLDMYASIEATARNNISFDHNTPGGNNCGLKFSAGGGGRHTIEGNVAFNNVGYAFEASNPSNPLRVYRPSRVYNNLAYNCSQGLLLGITYDTSFPGFEKVYIRNNILSDQSGHDIYGMSDGLEDSDHNFISNASDLRNMRNIGQDANTLTGDPGLVDKTAVIDTNFTPGWSIDQKMDYIRNQVKAAFSLAADSQLIDAGAIIDGYHCPRADDDPVDPMPKYAPGKHWSGTAPDIGVYEYDSSPSILLGDVTGDGDISAYDASLCAQYAIGLIDLTADAVLRADVTQNGDVSAYDASLISQYAIGLIGGF